MNLKVLGMVDLQIDFAQFKVSFKVTSCTHKLLGLLLHLESTTTAAAALHHLGFPLFHGLGFMLHGFHGLSVGDPSSHFTFLFKLSDWLKDFRLLDSWASLRLLDHLALFEKHLALDVPILLIGKGPLSPVRAHLLLAHLPHRSREHILLFGACILFGNTEGFLESAWLVRGTCSFHSTFDHSANL